MVIEERLWKDPTALRSELFSMEQRIVGFVVLSAMSMLGYPSGPGCWCLLLGLLSRFILLIYCVEQWLGPDDVPPAPSSMLLPAAVAPVAEAEGLLSSVKALHRDHCLGLPSFLKGPCSRVCSEHQGLESGIDAVII